MTKMAHVLPFILAFSVAFLPIAVHGQGSCTPGFYSSNGACQPCPHSSFCAGGSAPPTACGEGLKHIIATAAEAAQCVTSPGHGYKVHNGTAFGELCSVGRYNPGNNKLPCTPCPNNLTTGSEGSTDVTSCGVPQGYYVAGGNNTIIPCEKGTYQPEVSLAQGCVPCPKGSTTSNTASTDASDCKLAWPGWYIHISDGTAEADAIYATATDGSSNSTMTKFRRCPPNTFNNGHNTATTCVDCPIGTSTRFDIDKRDYYYNSEYYDRYHVAANTEDMCAPLEDHVPFSSVVVGGKQLRMYTSFSGHSSKYSWLWTSFESGPAQQDVSSAEMTCSMLGGHLPSLHSQAQAEHLIGTHMALWPRTNSWSYAASYPHMLWLGFFTNSSYSSMYMYNWQTSSYADAWSDYSPADWPGMNAWNPGWEGRALQVVWGNSSIDTRSNYRGSLLPYACAFNYTPSEVASSSQAVMIADRTWTLFTAQADYTAAVEICTAHGMQLASVHSATDNQALASLAANHTQWSGGHVGGSVMLGIRYNTTLDVYAWQDGSRVDWLPLDFNTSQQPPIAPMLNYSRECVVLLANGSWAPVSCTRQPASFVCQRLVSVNEGDCAPGFYLSDGICTVCPRGSWCAGGQDAPAECGEGLTTILATASNPEQHCGTKPGFGYRPSSNTTAAAIVICPVGIYNVAGTKHPCVPCPGNLTTSAAGATDSTACGAPRGYYVATGKTIRPCDQGSYQPDVALASECVRCPQGSATSDIASTQASDCNVVWPGWYMVVANDSASAASNSTDESKITNSTSTAVYRRCPANTFNNGFNTATSCTGCPFGTSTRTDINYQDYYYYYGYNMGYGYSANTEDICAPLEEHVPYRTVLVRGQQHQVYTSFSGSGTRYEWLWSSFNQGPVQHHLNDAEWTCSMLGGHLPSLHSRAQAEHLIGTHMALWPRTNSWSYMGSDTHTIWLGFFTNSSYSSMYMYNWQTSSYPDAWSDYSPADWPGMNAWNPGWEGRALQVVWGNSSIDTRSNYRGSSLPYACAFNYTPSEIASSSHAVMLADRAWTLFTAQADYAAAVTICSANGMKLATVHSAADNQALAGLAANDTNWSGGRVGGSVFLGLKFVASAGTYEWQDGSAVVWSPSDFNIAQQPPIAPMLNYSRECVVLLANGSWAPVSCTRQPASFVCQRLVSVNEGDCAPGFYLSDGICTVCPSGSWCAGGQDAPAECGEGLTTILATASDEQHCGTQPGYGYQPGHGGSASMGILCPVGTYNVAGTKRQCAPCPGNRTTSVAGSSDVSACGAPQGHYIAQDNVIKPCASGTYQPDVALVTECIHCPEGSTTAGPASTQASDCNLAWPGWYITVGNDSSLVKNRTQGNATDVSSNIRTVGYSRCPPNTFNNGHNTATSCTACPYGTSTKFDIYYGYYGYGYGFAANTEDMCALLEEHVPSTSVVVRGQTYAMYTSYSANGVKYSWMWRNFNEGPARRTLSEAENECALMGGHLPSLHSQAQAEHLIGTHMALWPRTTSWSYSSSNAHEVWLGFYAQKDPYFSMYNMYMSSWQARFMALAESWSDWSAPDWPDLMNWEWSQARVLAVSWGNSTIETRPRGRSWESLPYACAFNYTPSEVASSSHAVMLADRTWTLFTAQADYAAAVDICSAHGMQLASAHSAADNQALADLAAKDTKWSGGVVGGSVLLGLKYKASAGGYEWQDGTPVDWSPEGFNLSQQLPIAPRLNYSRECVMVLANGSWAPVSCTRQPASFVCQNTPEGYTYISNVWSNEHEALCPTQTYITATTKGQPIRLKLQTWGPDTMSTFVQITVHIEEWNEHALRAMGFNHWSSAMIPLQRVAQLPPYAAYLPAPGHDDASSDSCAVTAVVRQTTGSRVLLYARLAESPAGVHLEILGKLQGSNGTPQPVRAVVKFLSSSMDNSTHDFSEYDAGIHFSPGTISAPQGTQPSPSPHYDNLKSPSPSPSPYEAANSTDPTGQAPSPSPTPGLVNALKCYQFYPTVDTNASTNMAFDASLQDMPEGLANICDQLAGCVGFSTAGYLKSDIPDAAEWVKVTDDNNQGVYIKNCTGSTA